MRKSRQPLNSCCLKVLPALVLGALLGACSETFTRQESAANDCRGNTIPISSVQGKGYRSPLVDSDVTISGIVTHISTGGGFYLENSEPRKDGAASRAIFIADDKLPGSVQSGQRLEISGRVTETGSGRDTLTALTEISRHRVCGGYEELPVTTAELPMDSPMRESLEGMRVELGQSLTVTDVYQLAKGEVTLSPDGVLRIPTEVAMPGVFAQRLEQKNRSAGIVANLPSPPAPVPVGSVVRTVTGVMGHNGRDQQLFPERMPTFEVPSPPALEPAANGHIRIVSSNLLNFFNGDGSGGGFPTERGAKSPVEFAAQSNRTRAVMERIQPHLLAVQELENDGFGPDSAAHSLLTLLNAAGKDDWAFIAPGNGPIGGDVITVGLYYRQDILEAIGPPQTLDSDPFTGLSRRPLAQAFRERRSGKTFLVAANHLKSKGSCPDDGPNMNQRDGQGCWNRARVEAVNAQLPWLAELAKREGTGNILVLGDMNAWRNEDPIRQFADAGYVDLVEHLAGLPQHSFLYWGQTGTLDYTFASPPMAEFARHAVIWHINADWPRNMEQFEPWLRASDHDPVIVDFDFSHPSTSD
jgi:hypothetical protein